MITDMGRADLDSKLNKSTCFDIKHEQNENHDL